MAIRRFLYQSVFDVPFPQAAEIEQTPPDAAFASSPGIRRSPRGLGDSVFYALAPIAAAAVVITGVFSESPQPVLQPPPKLPTHALDFGGFGEFTPPIEQTPPNAAFATSPSIVQATLDLGDFASYFNFVPVAAVTPLFAESPVLFQKPLNASLQRFSFDDALKVIIQSGPVFTESPVLFQKPFRTALEKISSFDALQVVVSVTPQGWWGRWPDVFAKPFPAQL